ncbi:hypothetical protein ACFWXO_05475 [Kitasatospora sp. NPDC059088]|uniref:hypothetical protein n=1 Tax=Kitasatospora sp. NPDC059088 TaxID=3346722 RepID=UPI00368F699B
MTDRPVVIRPPQTLLDEPRRRLSHGGILDTPAGLFTVLVFEHQSPPARAEATPSWTVYLTEPGARHAVLALARALPAPDHSVHFVACSFGPLPDPGRLVLVVQHRDLPHPRTVDLRTPPPRGGAAVSWLAAPGPLPGTGTEPARAWHSGLLRTPSLVFTHLEANTVGPDTLATPEWDLSPHRPESRPRPLAADFTPSRLLHGTATGGDRFSSYDAVYAAPESGAPFTWTCAPLGLFANATTAGVAPGT